MDFPVKVGKETRVTLAGKLDFARAPELMNTLTTLKGQDISSIVFECKELTYISSSGIRAIMFAQQKIVPNMRIIMEDVCADVSEVLDVCGLSEYIEFPEPK